MISIGHFESQLTGRQIDIDYNGIPGCSKDRQRKTKHQSVKISAHKWSRTVCSRSSGKIKPAKTKLTDHTITMKQVSLATINTSCNKSKTMKEAIKETVRHKAGQLFHRTD